jgi:hypothetical protein
MSKHQVLRVRLMLERDNCHLVAQVANRKWRDIDRLDDGWEFVAFVPESAVPAINEQNSQFALFRKQDKEVETEPGDQLYRWARKVGTACA